VKEIIKAEAKKVIEQKVAEKVQQKEPEKPANIPPIDAMASVELDESEINEIERDFWR